MQIFRGTATNRIDSKGRVSVPARFRGVIESDALRSVYCHQSLTQKALDAGGRRLLNEVEGMLSNLNPYSDDYDALAHALIGASEEIALDGEGRITLPEPLRRYANLKDQVTFVGLGIRFQLWDPDSYKKYLASARTRSRKVQVRGILRPNGASGEKES